MARNWNRWLIWGWGAVSVGLITAAFLLPFRRWAVLAAVGFGLMEAVGLARPDDAHPSLTDVIRKYVPREIALTAMYGFTGAAGAAWLGFADPKGFGLLFAFVGWLTTHLDLAYDRKLGEEVERLQALGGLAKSSLDRVGRALDPTQPRLNHAEDEGPALGDPAPRAPVASST